MADSPGLEAYTRRLRRLTPYQDPLAATTSSASIRAAADTLDALPDVEHATLVRWITEDPDGVYVLGLAVGLTQEKLRNQLRGALGTTSWVKAARTDPAAVVDWMDQDFDLLASLEAQRGRTYTFGDVLVGRALSRQTASSAGVAGRLVEDEVEAVVRDLGLPYRMRGRFRGVDGRTGPADLAIPDFDDCVIAIGCKGFDSTGSKLTAAVSEITEMVGVHRPHQYILAVVDGIGWRGRMGDFRRMYDHFEQRRIEGLYTLADLDVFRDDLAAAARRAQLL